MSLLEEIGRNNQWFALARSEIKNAKILSKYDAEERVICYHYHQAVEKCLIGYLLSVTGELPEGRNLIHLCKMAMRYDASFSEILNDIAILDSYYFEEDYPSGCEPPVITTEDTVRCFKIVKKIIAKVQLLINSEK